MANKYGEIFNIALKVAQRRYSRMLARGAVNVPEFFDFFEQNEAEFRRQANVIQILEASKLKDVEII